MWRRFRNKYSCPAVCAIQWRQPSLFGDDTHAVVTRPKWAWRARTTQGAVPCAGGLRAWPIDRCSSKDTGKGERKTPTLAYKGNRQKERIARRRETTKVQTCNRHAAKFYSALDKILVATSFSWRSRCLSRSGFALWTSVALTKAACDSMDEPSVA